MLCEGDTTLRTKIVYLRRYGDERGVGVGKGVGRESGGHDIDRNAPQEALLGL